MAPLVKELAGRSQIDSTCCITAQHREMLDDVLHLFDITPDYDLDIMEAGQSLYTITTKCLLGLEKVFLQEKPDLVLVHGDTSTTFAAALACAFSTASGTSSAPITRPASRARQRLIVPAPQ